MTVFIKIKTRLPLNVLSFILTFARNLNLHAIKWVVMIHSVSATWMNYLQVPCVLKSESGDIKKRVSERTLLSANL